MVKQFVKFLFMGKRYEATIAVKLRDKHDSVSPCGRGVLQGELDFYEGLGKGVARKGLRNLWRKEAVEMAKGLLLASFNFKNANEDELNAWKKLEILGQTPEQVYNFWRKNQIKMFKYQREMIIWREKYNQIRLT